MKENNITNQFKSNNSEYRVETLHREFIDTAAITEVNILKEYFEEPFTLNLETMGFSGNLFDDMLLTYKMEPKLVFNDKEKVYPHIFGQYFLVRESNVNSVVEDSNNQEEYLKEIIQGHIKSVSNPENFNIKCCSEKAPKPFKEIKFTIKEDELDVFLNELSKELQKNGNDTENPIGVHKSSSVGSIVQFLKKDYYKWSLANGDECENRMIKEDFEEDLGIKLDYVPRVMSIIPNVSERPNGELNVPYMLTVSYVKDKFIFCSSFDNEEVEEEFSEFIKDFEIGLSFVKNRTRMKNIFAQ